MSKITDNLYDINDIFIIKIKDEYKIKTNDEYIQTFNPNFCHFVERFLLETKDELKIEIETFSECFTGETISCRENLKKDNDIPEMFEFMYPLPKEYLTKDELESGKIRTLRLYQIFQLINYERFNKQEELGSSKVKKIGNMK